MGDVVFLRFDEPSTDVLPSDELGSLADLRADGGATMPEVVTGAIGYAREFVAANATRLHAVDVVPGSSLLTRTASIQAIVRWDIDDQALAATPGVIVCHGEGGSSSERVAYGLELRVVNAGARVGEVRWFWEDLAGTRYTAIGGQFQLERASEWLMLTAVRHWTSAGEVVLRYYLGDALLNEVVTASGEIGGGTTGTTTVGAQKTGGVWGSFLDGAIDELRIVDGEITGEEIAATWLRLSVLQPAGRQLIDDCLPPGLPISDDPDARVQRELDLMGTGLGYAMCQVENVRANILPDRAYGRVLERWEGITRQTSKPGDDISKRRKRVAGRLAQRAGVSPPGVRAATAELLACGEDQLTLLGYSNTIRDSFDTLVASRWKLDPGADWSVAASVLRAQLAGGISANALTGWRTCLTGVDGPERIGGFGAQVFTKLAPTAIPDGAEAGIVLHDYPRRDALMLGLRNDGGAYKVVSQRIIGGAVQAAVVHAVTALEAHWLHLFAVPVDYSGQARADLVQHGVRWSTTSATAGFTAADPGAFSFSVGWCGFYARAWNGAALGGPVDVSFDDAALWFPNGLRPFHFYVLRDPALPGSYDLAGASAMLRKLRQAHTHAAAIARAMSAGDPTGYGPCGGV